MGLFAYLFLLLFLFTTVLLGLRTQTTKRAGYEYDQTHFMVWVENKAVLSFEIRTDWVKNLRFSLFLELLSCKQRNGDRLIPVLAGMLPGVGRSDMDWLIPYENHCWSCERMDVHEAPSTEDGLHGWTGLTNKKRRE